VKYKISDDPVHLYKNHFVRAVEFDAEGNLWFGADNHLYQLGDELVEYNSENSNLPDSIIIWEIEKDHNHNLWMRSNHGLIKYEKSNFTIFDSSNSPANCHIHDFEIAADNTIWFCNEKGLTKWSQDSWTIWNPENSDLEYYHISAIKLDDSGNLWLTTGKKLFKISDQGWQKFENEKLYNCHNILFDKNNNIWLTCDYSISSIAYTDDLPKLLIFNKNGWHEEKPKILENQGFFPFTGFTDRRGYIWLANMDDLVYYTGKSWNKMEIGAAIWDICEDENGDIWLGTSDGIFQIKVEDD
jgi:ligand-binding sensor domain-containing protein